ncbi:hypothetical protein [Simiduia aestuariiviva]|uniref:FHA domain-containing protein n=1 Tax=Simiduia aestuariiviva TaxID=1510459 RepID=A0A839UTX1_9GAMM|nr:hypothetical protein [Simiduia aestuariiviva]MBB3168827.1 hypothetical protein [Simiduia aestuariiviva]
MTCSLLHLNDVQVQLIDADGERLSEPAQLVFDKDTLLSGQDALAKVRLMPLRAYNQHWQLLHQQPVKLPDARYRHHADLAFRQLERWLTDVDRSRPLLIAPSYRYQSEQYALLAGMVQATHAKPGGFIHAALLHSHGFLQQHAATWPLIHVDLCLHQAHVTQLECRDGQLTVTREWDLADFGMANLVNAWLHRVAKRCIQQTRYDPLHSADSEQRLFNQWQTCLQQLQQNSELQLDIDGNEVTLTRADVTELYQGLLTQIKAIPGTRLLSPVAQWLPGIDGHTLTHQHLQLALTDLSERFATGDSVHLIHRLPLPNTTPTPPQTALPAATHVLVGNEACALDDQLRISTQGQLTCDPQTAAAATFAYRAPHWYCRPSETCIHNGLPLADHAPLAAGDELTIAGLTLRCIVVTGSNHGA